MHVLGPPPISANSIGLLGLLLLGWGWKHRRGLARSSCWGLCALCATSPSHTLLATAAEMDVPVVVTAGGDEWIFESSTFKSLWPPKNLVSRDRNHASLALEIVVHGRRFRLSGDADSKSMISEIENEPSADVFELPHHGARCRGLASILQKRPPRLLLQSSSRRRAQKGLWHTWSGSPHLATGLHGGICIRVDSSGYMTAAAQNRFYTWPPDP